MRPGWHICIVARGLAPTGVKFERDVKEGFEPSLRRILEGESHGPGRPAGRRILPTPWPPWRSRPSAGRPWSEFRCSGSTG